jgi:signal transduction histidine kinase
MNVTLVWPRIRTRLVSATLARRDGLWRVTLRLAGLTVGLLLVMLIVLEVVVYLITGQALRGSLEDILTTRANQPDPTVCAALRLRCPFPNAGGPRGGPAPAQGAGTGSVPPQRAQPSRGGSSGFSGPRADTTPSDANSAYVYPDLRFIHADGDLGEVLLDPGGARQAISTRTAQCCSVRSFKGEDYLVYTRPIVVNGRAIAAVQTSVSEHQYEGTLGSLRQSLLVVALLGIAISGGISAALVARALQPIRAAVRRQQDFVADAAHELRTPLAIQRTVGEVGMAEASVDDLQATVAQMLGENQHLTRLVEDLSLLARADTDAVAIDRRPVDLSSLVVDTAAELGPLAEGQGVTLETEVQPNVRCMGDILRLRQLLLILLDNALKHTPSGGVVRVRLGPQHDRARLEVIDSGPGIAPHDLGRVFDRFYRADQARTGEGSGLGLAIAKWIVEAHGGQIHAGNTSPHGAVFTVTLPQARVTSQNR